MILSCNVLAPHSFKYTYMYLSTRFHEPVNSVLTCTWEKPVKSRSGDRDNVTEGFCGFSVSAGECWHSTLNYIVPASNPLTIPDTFSPIIKC
jgi:hypothetical protein